MNIEQAVQNLEDIKSKYTWSIGADGALDMAISALRAQNLQPTCNQLATDCISRQAAIDALARMMPRSYTPDGSHPADEEIFRAQEVFADCIEALEILPSAQPATNCSEIPNGSDDTISRQAAIDTEGLDEQIKCEMCRNPMHTVRGCDGNCKYDERLYERIIQILDERIKPLPSAQPYLQPTCNNLATDTISRQAAIEALRDAENHAFNS